MFEWIIKIYRPGLADTQNLQGGASPNILHLFYTFRGASVKNHPVHIQESEKTTNLWQLTMLSNLSEAQELWKVEQKCWTVDQPPGQEVHPAEYPADKIRPSHSMLDDQFTEFLRIDLPIPQK